MVIHIDMSGKYYSRKTIGIACYNPITKWHVGLALKNTAIKKLIKHVHADHDFPRLHAICIHHLLNGYLANVEKIIICNDEPFHEVRDYLDILFNCTSEYHSIIIDSITKYRKDFGVPKMKSPADNLASAYRKRALKAHQPKKGHKLHPKYLTITKILEKWKLIDKSLRK